MATFFVTAPEKEYFGCDDSFNVNLGQVKCNLGVLNFIARGSAAGPKFLDLVVGISEMGTAKWPQRTLMKFQLELSLHSYRRRPSSTGSQDSATPTLGPISKAIQNAKKGTVVTSTFAFPDNNTDARWAIKQLSVTVDCVYDLVLPVGHSSSSSSSARATPFFSSALDLVDSINDPCLSDCRLQLQDGSCVAAGVLVAACKLVLARASPFFLTMFKEPQWAAGDGKGDAAAPIKFDSWSIKAFIPCLIHMYTGWVPYHGELPRPSLIEGVIVKHDVVPGKYVLTEWLEVLHLAEMIELAELVKGVKRANGRIVGGVKRKEEDSSHHCVLCVFHLSLDNGSFACVGTNVLAESFPPCTRHRTEKCSEKCL